MELYGYGTFPLYFTEIRLTDNFEIHRIFY